MKTLNVGVLLLAMVSHVVAQEGKAEQKERIERENIEWCDIWIPSAPKTDKPRVLLVGDSITKGYYRSVCKQLNQKAYCAKFATSACVSDPAFHKQLKALLSQYEFRIVHFNNGLHGIGYTEEEYRVGYEQALTSIRTHSPSTKLILALSTPLKEDSDLNHLNPRMNERNRIVCELAKEYGATINDLHAISEGHPEYYRDSCHFGPIAIDLQAEQVADRIMERLTQASPGVFENGVTE